MKKIKAVLSTIIDTLEGITITTETTSKSSHGRTTATTTTRIRREAQTAETTNDIADPWLVEASGWQPADCRRSDGCKEMWGKPRISLDGNISVPVRIVDEDVTVNEYTLALSITVRNQAQFCARQARIDVIRGSKPWIPLDVQRARRLLAHHEGEQAWEELRGCINELYSELNEVAAAAVKQK